MFSRHNNYEEQATKPLIAKPTLTSQKKSKYREFLSVLRPSHTTLKALGCISCAVCILFVIVTVILFPVARSSSLTSCLHDAYVPFVVQDSPDWKALIRPWNVRLTYIPAAVAIPDSIEQIQVAVNCGIRNNMRVTAKGGGHSFGSYGLGGEDGHLVIELQQLNDVTVFENGTAKIQPGARLGHVSTELYKQGGRAIPHGACPGSVFPPIPSPMAIANSYSVGLAGHALHGGYGRVSRTHGLTLDWMTGAQVILADGSMVFCSAQENSDLFWALQGAGSSFGIVVEFEFKTFKAPEYVTPFTIELPWNEQAAFEAFSALQDFALVAPQTLNMFSFVTATSQVIQGLYFGDKNGLIEGLQPLLERLKTTISYMETVGWLEGLEHYADGEPLDSPAPYNAVRIYFITVNSLPLMVVCSTGRFIPAVSRPRLSAKDNLNHLPRRCFAISMTPRPVTLGISSSRCTVALTQRSPRSTHLLLLILTETRFCSGSSPTWVSMVAYLGRASRFCAT
jgi:hypothetical protein